MKATQNLSGAKYSKNAERSASRVLRAAVEALEGRVLLAADAVVISAANALSFVGSPDNTVVTESYSAGTYTINDSTDIINVTNSGAAVAAGSGTHTITVTGATSLAFDTGGGSDTFNIESINNPTSVGNTFSPDGTAQTVNVGSAGSLQGIDAALTVHNTDSHTSLTLDDSADATARTATLTGAQITGLAPSTISFDAGALSALLVEGGGAGNTFTVNGTPYDSNAALVTSLDSGTGLDTLKVLATTGTNGANLLIDGQDSNDNVMIGGVPGVGMQHIFGNVKATNSNDVNNLTLDDSGNPSFVDATFNVNAPNDPYTNAGSVTGLAPATISFNVSDVYAFTVDGGPGGNTFNINNTVFNSPNTFNTGTGANVLNVAANADAQYTVLNINGQGGDDIINFGNSSNGVQNMFGTVNVTNAAGKTSLGFNDSADATGRTVSVSGTALTGLAPAKINYTAGQINNVQITAGTGSDTFNVTPANGTTIGIDGNAPAPPASPGDTLNLNLSGITGAVNSDTLSASGHSGSWNFANANTVDYSHFETLTPASDLSVSLSGPAIATEGSLLIYNVSVTNNGPSDAPDATLTDTLGSEAKFVSLNFPGAAASSFTGGSATVNLGTLAAGSTATGTIVVNARAAGYLSDALSAASDYPDPNTANNGQTIYTTVLDAPLTPTGGRTLHLNTGQAFSGVVGGFTDADPNGQTGDYTAQIHWGDGATTAGVIVPDGAGFDVTGSHTYGSAGTKPITVSIADIGGSTATDNGTAYVVTAPLTGYGTTFTAHHGVTFTGVIGSFADADTLSTKSGIYSAKIYWGDGTNSHGTISYSASTHRWVVTGSHKYAHAGHFTVNVGVYEDSISASSNSFANVL